MEEKKKKKNTDSAGLSKKIMKMRFMNPEEKVPLIKKNDPRQRRTKKDAVADTRSKKFKDSGDDDTKWTIGGTLGFANLTKLRSISNAGRSLDKSPSLDLAGTNNYTAFALKETEEAPRSRISYGKMNRIVEDENKKNDKKSKQKNRFFTEGKDKKSNKF